MSVVMCDEFGVYFQYRLRGGNGKGVIKMSLNLVIDFFGDLSTSDVIGIASLLVAAATLVIAFKTWRDNGTGE